MGDPREAAHSPDWRSGRLDSHSAIIGLREARLSGRKRWFIAATKTKTGLPVQCDYDPNWYPNRRQDNRKRLRRHSPYDPTTGGWNYSIAP